MMTTIPNQIRSTALADAATGWSECLPLVARSGALIIETFAGGRALFPFPLRVAGLKARETAKGAVIMAKIFEPGDIVQLKSGGPNMTVIDVWPEFLFAEIWCKWFDDKNDTKEGSFPAVALKPVARVGLNHHAAKVRP